MDRFSFILYIFPTFSQKVVALAAHSALLELAYPSPENGIRCGSRLTVCVGWDPDISGRLFVACVALFDVVSLAQSFSRGAGEVAGCSRGFEPVLRRQRESSPPFSKQW